MNGEHNQENNTYVWLKGVRYILLRFFFDVYTAVEGDKLVQYIH